MKHGITVMTFNLRVIAAKDPFDWEQRKYWIAAVIDDCKPDLIGTQEATIPMLGWLKERYEGEYDIYGENRNNSLEVGEFCAVFVKKAKFSVIRKQSFMLSETPEVIGSKSWDSACERICSWVELAGKEDGKPMLRLFNTHLDHKGTVARQEGLKLVLDKIRDVNQSGGPLPSLVAGDFNAKPDSGLFDVLKDYESVASCYDLFTEEEKLHSRTFHDYNGGSEGSPIDYILGCAGIRFVSTAIRRDRIEDGYPSDHYPVLSSVSWESYDREDDTM
ncbi:endonuclease/exonuclease/phosphatase family protein [Paenibacillus hemerocallicola]|uniref:Endonuclease/exonuclease/phosphatase family protein n=1 Tax=Paenibacillus hemerocallicola TaxID=1172614 RepID=A0A5C4SWU3_9BACL|nr:endonuclease/exonuclease/phosphatase family protein [Paenibacillus hemerocallicola]TNJ58063.1 endonuclease/exonuclease/phosphatase family protein [Paenibacillus hemerocallicola]